MASGPRRYFTTPLSSGRSTHLGQSDPRTRRDNNARVTSVDDPLTLAAAAGLSAADVQALIDASMATVEAPVVEESLTFEQGTYAFGGSTTFYGAFGADGNWDSFENTATSEVWLLNQTGSKPITPADFAALAFPVPAP